MTDARDLRQRYAAEIGRYLTCACDFGEQDNYPAHAPCRHKVLDAVLHVRETELADVLSELGSVDDDERAWVNRTRAWVQEAAKERERAEAAECTLAAIRERCDQEDERARVLRQPRGFIYTDEVRRILDDHTEAGDQKRYTLTIRNTAECGCVLDGGLNLIEACDYHTEAGDER